LDEMGNCEEAIAAYDEALNLPEGKANLSVWKNKTLVCLKLNRIDDAMESC